MGILAIICVCLRIWNFTSVEPESRLLCSAAIKLQRPGREDSIWALDKLEDRMSEMRSEIYSSEDVSELSFTTTPLGNAPPGAIANLKSDPFYEEQQQRFFIYNPPIIFITLNFLA